MGNLGHNALPDFALFWDFASLCQKPRTQAEEPLFLPGLKGSNIWYGHQLSVCWMQTALPEGFAQQMLEEGLARDYDESGWCFVEAAISACLKMGKRRLDLANRAGYSVSPDQYSGITLGASLDDVLFNRLHPAL